MGHFRWIDARQGVLEIIDISDPRILFFSTMKVKIRTGRDFFRTSRVLQLVNNDGVFYYIDDQVTEEPEYRVVDDVYDAKLLEHYQSWLARVMLAEDIHKSRAEERKTRS